ncbi:MAG TPA: tetratricopeptide repeat protein, partial [Spirochaetota bacterium]|nr:tetratricopeptide repeat protein [Spirochaetota bacterium]
MWDNAIEEYQTAIDLSPMNDQAHFFLGVAYREKGMYEQAANEFERSLQINSSLADAHEELGMIYYRKLKNNDKAIYHFEKLLSMKPNHPKADQIRDIIAMLKK